jgi:hypothetical protein
VGQIPAWLATRYRLTHRAPGRRGRFYPVRPGRGSKAVTDHDFAGYDGNSTEGSEVVWRIGGLMAYAAFSMLLFAAFAHMVGLEV